MKNNKLILIILICCALLSAGAAVIPIVNSMIIREADNKVVDVTQAPDMYSSGNNSTSSDKDIKNNNGSDPTSNPTEEPTIEPPKTAEPYEPAKSLDPTKPIVALSFDDGPSAKATNRILDTLEKYNITATFFIVGDMAENHEAILSRAVSLGCEIGNHTTTHKTNFKNAEIEAILEELDGVDRIVKAAIGEETQLIRPPWGSYTQEALDATGRPFINWSVDTLDWKTRDADAVFEAVKNDARDGYIILMHDIYESTAEAVEMVVPWLIENGYQVCSVSEMFAARGISLEPGNMYRKAPTAQEYMDGVGSNG